MQARHTLSFLNHGGATAEAIREVAWGSTPLGPLISWPQSLQTLVGVMLSCRQPMFMAWGREKTWLYNDAFIPLLGDKHPSALGRPALEVWAEAREPLEPLFNRVFAGESIHRPDVRLTLHQHDRAKEAHFSFSYTPARDETGAIAGLFGVCVDTTELHTSLEMQMLERAAELERAQDALRHSQKMEAVGQLTGGLAHDFNNLLAGISGSLEVIDLSLTQGKLANAKRYIKMAQASTRRAAALTQRLLAFSRRQTLDPKPVDANRLIAGMEDLIRRSAGPVIDVKVLGVEDLWLTRVDPSQLENALLNLCLNARDAMAPAGGHMSIETANTSLDEKSATERELTPGEYLVLSVSDTGTGMPPEVAARAFDPFFTTKPIGVGTGLGLSMVYGFARQSGGRARIDTEVGKGTTICLYLPRYCGSQEIFDAAEPAAIEGSAAAGETA
jgi:signal transduction histidine kinase